MAQLRQLTLTDEAYDTLQLLATYTNCTKRRNDTDLPNTSQLLELIGTSMFTLTLTPPSLIPTHDSLYPAIIKSLIDNNKPPIARYSSAAVPRGQRGFYISDAAYYGLQQIAHDFGLRHHLKSPKGYRSRSDDTQVGNVSLLIELLGEGVYTIRGTQTGAPIIQAQ
jgi:hypothetical protein